jgi:hypothetical protein
MSLNALLITQKNVLQEFTLSCQYVKIRKYSDMLWLSKQKSESSEFQIHSSKSENTAGPLLTLPDVAIWLSTDTIHRSSDHCHDTTR